MLTHPTLDQMAALGLTGMLEAWKALSEQDPDQALDRNEWLGLMLDREAAARADKRFANRLRNARMRFPNACIEDINFAASRDLDRRQILSLAQGDWIRAREQIILTGQTGTGKTWLACAFAHQAARLDHSVSYIRMPRLFEDMAMARLDGRFPRLVDKLARVQLLVLDDWGTHGLTDQQRLDLLELFEERYQRRSTIITAQLPVSGWHDMIGEPTIAVDTHIFRVSNRTGLAPGKTPDAVEAGLERATPPEFKKGAHHWLILHGRYVCKARKPECWHCAIADLCRYTPKTPDPANVSSLGPRSR